MCGFQGTTNWSIEQLLALIHIYRQYPCLYRISDVDFNNSCAHRLALLDMKNRVNVVKPCVSAEDIIDCVENLSMNFIREYNAKIDLQENFEPSTWFHRMGFLLQFEPNSHKEIIPVLATSKSNTIVNQTRCGHFVVTASKVLSTQPPFDGDTIHLIFNSLAQLTLN